MLRSRSAATVSFALVLLSGGWKIAQFVFDAASTPENASKLWGALMSAPALIPWIILALSLATLAWSVWPKKERGVATVSSGPVPSDPNASMRAEIERLRLERARLDAEASLEFRRGLDAYARLDGDRIRASQEWQRTTYPAMNMPIDLKRGIIAKGRDLAHRFEIERPQEAFQTFLRKERDFMDVQPHLGLEYQRWVGGRGQILTITGDGSDYECSMFKRELARLEKEWDLV